MIELTDQMRIVGLGIALVVSSPFMFVCGWMVHKYHILSKSAKSVPQQKKIAAPEEKKTDDDIAKEALNLLVRTPSSMPGSANLITEDD